MAIGDPYAEISDYKKAIPLTGSKDDDTLRQELIAVSRYIDFKLDRPSGFNLDVAATVRIYMPKSSGRAIEGWQESENPWKYGGATRVLDVEDIGGAVTSIQIDEDIDNTFSTTLATTDYELLPRNAAVGPEAQPYKQIALTPWGTQFAWPRGARVRVTAIHGWPAVPAAIKMATIEIAAMLRVESVFATNQIMEIDQTVAASPQARSILNGLMTNYHGGVHF